MKNNETQKDLYVSPAPHITHKDSVPKIMWIVFISLLPAAIWAVYYFGLPALKVIIASIFSCLITETLLNIIRKQPLSIKDGSAAVTGLLLAFTLPPQLPIYIPITAGVFGIGIAKQLFGGIGYNVVNPALAGRVFVMFSWLEPMTASNYFFTKTSAAISKISAISSATPLTLIKNMKKLMVATKKTPEITNKLNAITKSIPKMEDLFFGKVGGSIGEVSALFILIGGLWLLKRKYITWHMPVSFIGSVFLFGFLFALGNDVIMFPNYTDFYNYLYYAGIHVFGGALFLGAIYMATDMVTTPLAYKGHLIIGIACGFLTFVIRVYGGYPEGVMFAILLTSLFTPLIDRYTKPKIYGWGKAND